jgi:hypothetical protein
MFRASNAVAEHMRNVCPAEHCSPKECLSLNMPIVASFLVAATTVSFTRVVECRKLHLTGRLEQRSFVSCERTESSGSRLRSGGMS